MSSKIPVRTVFDGSGNATGLAEYQSGEFIPLSHGGIGAALSIGSAGQVLKVNSGASALEFGAVEAVINIDGATDLESATLATTDKFLVSDGGSEGRATLDQLVTLMESSIDAIGGNLTVTGNLTVNGSTTTVNSTNTTIDDNLLELNSGATSNANDSGIIIERGSTGDNAIVAWDESADKFVLGTTTATASSTGNLSITTGTLVANIEGNVTGNVTGNVSGTSGSTTGNAATATALETARNIAGQSFDGTGNITIASTDLSNTSAIALLTATQTFTNKTLTSPKINEDVVVTATATQLNHTVGVTSAIQTQLDAKATNAFAIAQAVALG
jgi:hypothetical protein